MFRVHLFIPHGCFEPENNSNRYCSKLMFSYYIVYSLIRFRLFGRPVRILYSVELHFIRFGVSNCYCLSHHVRKDIESTQS